MSAARLKFRLEFDGAAFCGWQLQSEADERKTPSIQGALESTLAIVLRRPGERIVVQGCGRTDAGVHAEEFFAHADVPGASDADLERLRHGLNSVLPVGVVVTSLTRAAADFHALNDVTRKTYEYRVLARRAKPVLELGRCLWLPVEPFSEDWFDRAAVREATRELEGEHDFVAFAAANFTAKTSVRRLFRAEFISEKIGHEASAGERMRFVFEGDGFLKQMVRNMVGTLLEVGQRKRAPASIRALLGKGGTPGNRVDAGACAEPQGLFLRAVTYEGPGR